ncbi:TetR/AcrR family transcriptional regulator [Streptomyces sp. NPDC088387]|uniref:TetR/AcrR family transcriptional regulator n=1 Tax=Streptomyces sp. NPDC088387 TaxID=3365859 RepID=UPI00380275ED
MPRLSEATRAKRREHVLRSAMLCFARDGFHATSMDDVIAATGMSSSAVYRYFRSKEELIDATVDVGIGLVRDVFAHILEKDPTPGPAQTFALLGGELEKRTGNPGDDLSRLALQTWAETLRRPALSERTRTLYAETRTQLTELASRWKAGGQLAADADPEATAAVVFTLMQGLIVTHHVATDVPTAQLVRGLAALGPALVGGA